jgi:hypothetical protein
VNPAVPAGEMPDWKRQAIQKVNNLSRLQPNWDAQGSQAPTWGIRQAAIDLLLRVPVSPLPTPSVVPVSGGGYHFEWTVGDRELEISIEHDFSVEALRVVSGVPIEPDEIADMRRLFTWLVTGQE